MTAVKSSTVTVDIVAWRTPESVNKLGMRGNWRTLHHAKKRWEYELGMLLLSARFPKGLQSVEASAVLRFTTRRRRDAGNHAFILEKSLGDVLQNGWIPDDTPDYFQWRGVTFDRNPGPARTTVTLIGRRA